MIGSKGIWYMLIAAFTFSLMKVSVKLVSHLPAVEVVFFRSLVSLVLSLFFLFRSKVHVFGNNKKLLLMRGVCGALALTMYFSLIQQIPLAAAASMQYLSPIFTAVLGVFIVKEKVSWKQYIFFGVSFIGVLLIQGVDARVSLIHLLIGVTSAVFTGLAYNLVRKLKTTEHPLVIILYFPMVTMPFAGIYCLFNWVQPQGLDWLVLFMVGTLTQIAQYFLTRSYQLEEVSNVSIVNYTGMLYAVVFGLLVFGESYSWLSYTGMGLIVTGVLLNILYKNRLKV
ncbi:DMT family transporter [Reichenbachiella versicolor]|uniref:DMT family transporter n=1 Tax=Reichenbachiella versicolor TaxID=1821036 RepID=UPI001FE3A4D7|nr:DMT family transporter [Reichenbachiella versicolor]